MVLLYVATSGKCSMSCCEGVYIFFIKKTAYMFAEKGDFLRK